MMCAASCVSEQDESLIALTTHLAQVQFRLRQVISAPDDSKEVMLKELEEFVIKGCHGNTSNMDIVQHTMNQIELLPSDGQSELVEKHIATDELSNRLDMQCGDVLELNRTSATLDCDDEQDLQFSSLLDDHDDHVESVTIKTASCHPQAVGRHGDYIAYVKQAEESSHEPPLPVVKVQPIRIEGFGSKDLNVQCHKDKQSYLTTQFMRLLSVLQCGCGISPQFYHHSNQIQSSNSHTSSQTSQELHRLSRAIDRISMLVRMTELDHMTSVKMATIEIELHTAVTMEMADSLLRLLSDGLVKKAGMFNKLFSTSQHAPPWQHKVWSLLKAYYDDKHQVVHPTQSLATSFDLPLSDKNSPKKTLIHVIQLMEKYYEQFPEGSLRDELKFRGLICKGFNLKHLSSWVQLLSNHTSLVKSSYSSQSFALQTGFQPIVIQLERLNELSVVPEVSLPNEQPILSHQFSIT